MGFTVAILGRPNVGKSSLFNRLVGRRAALVDATPGVSRDWREGEADLVGLRFRLLDTPGLEEAGKESLETRMSAAAADAAGQADLCLFLVDARAGITPEEFHFVSRLRRDKRRLILAANKCEGGVDAAAVSGIWRFGLGAPLPLSAAHGEGLAELREAILAHMEEGQASESASEASEEEEEGETPRPLSLAVIGRPNVGKSSLINRLLGEARMLAGPQPGITRDAIDTAWEWRGRPLRLVDTAGMRRPARMDAKLERMAATDALRAVRSAEVVLLLLDATEGFERQDARLANRIIEVGRGLVVGVNKMDLVADRAACLRQIRERLEDMLPQVAGIAPHGLSARKGFGLDELLEQVFAMHALWRSRIPTARLNQWLREAVAAHPLPMRGRGRLRLRYATQVSNCPPSFALFCNRAALPDSYRRYLIREARRAFGLEGVPMRWHVRVGENPYAPPPSR